MKNMFYYLNTNEIPSELSRENMISSHVKITCYFDTVAMVTYEIAPLDAFREMI